jgi:hypothetical protein
MTNRGPVMTRVGWFTSMLPAARPKNAETFLTGFDCILSDRRMRWPQTADQTLAQRRCTHASGVLPGQPFSARQLRTVPLAATFSDWLQAQRRKISVKSRLGESSRTSTTLGGRAASLHARRARCDRSQQGRKFDPPNSPKSERNAFASHDEGGIAQGRIASLSNPARSK